MEKEKIRIILDLVLILAVIICIAVFVVFISTVLQDGGQCVLNPATYFAKINNVTDICDVCKLGFTYTP